MLWIRDGLSPDTSFDFDALPSHGVQGTGRSHYFHHRVRIHRPLPRMPATSMDSKGFRRFQDARAIAITENDLVNDRSKYIASHATRAICVEHLSRNIQKNFGAPSRAIPNSSIRFSLTEARLQVGHIY